LYTTLFPPGFTENSWNLRFFGILPLYQGKGLGKKLFKLAETQAEATKTPIVLDTGTDLDIVIYRRLGLEVVGDVKIESEYGSQTLTVMVKRWD
jgi:GNAT superfamily N-acetyltransferase